MNKEKIKVAFLLPLLDGVDKQVYVDSLSALSGFLRCERKTDSFDFEYEFFDLDFKNPSDDIIKGALRTIAEKNCNAIVTFGDEIGRKVLDRLRDVKITVFNIAFSLQYDKDKLSTISAIRMWPSSRLLSCFVARCAENIFGNRCELNYPEDMAGSDYIMRYKSALEAAGCKFESSDNSSAIVYLGYGEAFFAEIQKLLCVEGEKDENNRKVVITENFLDDSKGLICPKILANVSLNTHSFEYGEFSKSNGATYFHRKISLLAGLIPTSASIGDGDIVSNVEGSIEKNSTISWSIPICKYFGYVCCELLTRGMKVFHQNKGPDTGLTAFLFSYFRDTRYFHSALGPLTIAGLGETYFPLVVNNPQIITKKVQGSDVDLNLREEQLTEFDSGYLLEKIDDNIASLACESVTESFKDDRFDAYVKTILDEIYLYSECRGCIAQAKGIGIQGVKIYSRVEDLKGEEKEKHLYSRVLEFIAKLPLGSFTEVIQLDSRKHDIEDNDTYRVYNVAREPVTLALTTESQSCDSLVLSKNIASINVEGHQVSLDKDSAELFGKIGQFDGYIYIIPANSLDKSNGKSTGAEVSYVLMHTHKKFSYLTVHILTTVVTRFFSGIFSALYSNRLEVANVKSAIGSIMSRNGSHNIGSHVLAALSHNVGTMPDDRILYQYIQNRMDYIATATTEFTLWRQPTMLVSVMMKEFMRQKHLLDYISSSEGLCAYKFQGQTIEKNQTGTIRLNIRRILDEGNGEWEVKSYLGKDNTNMRCDFIEYESTEGGTSDKDKRGDKSTKDDAVDSSRVLSAAIPGGVVGQHAFYTIIENVIRNAAKHEWSEAMRIWKIAESELKKVDKKYCPQNLDIYIDFVDNPGRQTIECRIWNNRTVSVCDTAQIKSDIVNHWRLKCLVKEQKSCYEEKVRSAAKEFLHWYRLLKRRKVDVQSGDLAFSVYSLIEDEENKISEKEPGRDAYICDKILGRLLAFPAVDGGFVIGNKTIKEFILLSIKEEIKELAIVLERKIRQSFIDDNGVLRKENWGIAEMRISAGLLRCQDIALIGGVPGAGDPLNIIKPVLVKNLVGDECVGYRFDVDKPKLLLVVLDDKKTNRDVSIINRQAACCGVTFVNAADLNVRKYYPYSYILFEHLSECMANKLQTHQFVLPFRCLCASTDKDIDEDRRLKFVPNYTGSFFTKKNFEGLLESQASAIKVCQELLEGVYADWLGHVRTRGFADKSKQPKVVLDIGGDSCAGSARTLISREELLRFVFENSFNAAIRSFLKENGPKAVTGSMIDTRPKGGFECRVVSVPSRFAALLYAIAEMPYRRIASVEELADFRKMDKGKLMQDESEIIRAQFLRWVSEILTERESVSVEDMNNEWLVAFNFKTHIYVGTYESFTEDKGCTHWTNRFIDYVSNVVLDQADSFLRKYEERIVTLPNNFKSDSDDGQPSWDWKIDDKLVQSVYTTSDSTKRDEALMAGDICCFRHGDRMSFQIADNYYEPLSGAQSILNAYVSFRRDLSTMKMQNSDAVSIAEAKCRATGFVTHIVESAASRILIIDERVMKFMREHVEVNNVIPGLRIAVADHNDPRVLKMFSSFTPETVPSFSGVKLTDFEIVIIHQGIIDKLLPGHETKEVVASWLELLTQKLHYVVITTGRGSPANIPDTARVLPYSVIASSILQRYPEKMILVDAVMNILPVRSNKGA